MLLESQLLAAGAWCEILPVLTHHARLTFLRSFIPKEIPAHQQGLHAFYLQVMEMHRIHMHVQLHMRCSISCAVPRHKRRCYSAHAGACELNPSHVSGSQVNLNKPS